VKNTIEALVTGDHAIARYYERACEHWRQILQQVDPSDVTALAERLSHKQTWFEMNCGGRWFGQEVMVVTGVAQFYSTDNGFAENFDKAKAVVNALVHSGCSVEVKHQAGEIGRYYGLTD
jgi:hypothetical protein